MNRLSRHIIKDQKTRDKHEDPFSMMIFNRSDNECTHKNLKSENNSFMWFQLLIEVLLNMGKHVEAKQELIEICRKQYEGNPIELTIIDQFQRSYENTKAIWWYTQESCIYRLLNKALRVQDIDMLVVFRFLIKDLFVELTKEHQKFKHSQNERSTRVFRGQLISTDEFTRIQASIGDFISINSFFSASQSPERALEFARTVPPSKDIQQILFEIQIDVSLSTKPFADVKHLSPFEDEKEFIFIVGSIFRITQVAYDSKYSIWKIHLSLCNAHDRHLQDLLAFYKKEISQNSTDAVSLSDLLFKMGEYNKANQYYNQTLAEQSTCAQSRANCYFGLGNVAIAQDKFSNALICHTTALDLKKKFLANNHRDLASSYNQIGVTYMKLENYQKAFDYVNQAFQIRQKCLHRNDRDLAESYRDIGLVQFRLRRNDLALANHFEAHDIFTKILPKDHPDIAENLRYIAYVYGAIGEYNISLKYLKNALKILKRSLPENHADIGMIFEAMGHCLYAQNNYISALDYFTRSLTIFRKSLPSTHESIQNVQQKIERTKAKLSQSSHRKKE